MNDLQFQAYWASLAVDGSESEKELLTANHAAKNAWQAATALQQERITALEALLKRSRDHLPIAAASWNEEPQYAVNVDIVLTLIADVDAALKEQE